MKGFLKGKSYPWSADILVYILFLVFSSVVSGLVLYATGIDFPGDTLMSLNYLLSFGILLALSFAYRAVRIGSTGSSAGVAGFMRVSNPKMALLGVAMMFAVQVVTEPLTNMAPEAERSYYDMLSAMGPWMVLTSVIAAPIAEELFFRAVLAGDVATVRGAVPAAFLSSVIFAAAHFSHWVQVVPAFLGGLVLAYVFLSTRSVWCAVFVHFVNNLVSQLYFLYSPSYESFSRPLYGMISNGLVYGFVYATAAMLLVVVLVIGYVRLSRRYGRKAESYRASEPEAVAEAVEERPRIISEEGLEDTYL